MGDSDNREESAIGGGKLPPLPCPYDGKVSSRGFVRGGHTCEEY